MSICLSVSLLSLLVLWAELWTNQTQYPIHQASTHFATNDLQMVHKVRLEDYGWKLEASFSRMSVFHVLDHIIHALFFIIPYHSDDPTPPGGAAVLCWPFLRLGFVFSGVRVQFLSFGIDATQMSTAAGSQTTENIQVIQAGNLHNTPLQGVPFLKPNDCAQDLPVQHEFNSYVQWFKEAFLALEV